MSELFAKHRFSLTFCFRSCYDAIEVLNDVAFSYLGCWFFNFPYCLWQQTRTWHRVIRLGDGDNTKMKIIDESRSWRVWVFIGAWKIGCESFEKIAPFMINGFQLAFRDYRMWFYANYRVEKVIGVTPNRIRTNDYCSSDNLAVCIFSFQSWHILGCGALSLFDRGIGNWSRNHRLYL